MDEVNADIKNYIRAELEKALKEKLDSLPWWCILCGVGGNYEGERPDQYWFPPEDHVCDPGVNFGKQCKFCSSTESALWWKCCPTHCSEYGPDVVCQKCGDEKHPEWADKKVKGV